MRLQLLCIACVSLYLSYTSQATKVGPPSAKPSEPSDKPFGAYYCQARCLASCLETSLAPNLDDCQKFCPPFGDEAPCKTDDAQCWRTCGVPPLLDDQPAPESPSLTPLIRQGSEQVERDPFLIELAWTAVPNASLYIVEFYPQNRQPKPGESNFFQVMTTSLTYEVRKEDECTEYSARVIAVNSYGISVPVYVYVAAPTPDMKANDHFIIRNMQRDPSNSDMITITIDYTFPLGWPVDDIELDSLRVTAIDCKGALGESSFGTVAGPSGVLNPSYDAIIGKSPATAIQLSFFDDMLKSDCSIQMRVSSMTTRCNTTITYEESLTSAPGIDFRINCNSVQGACDNDTEASSSEPPVLAPIPMPTAIDPAVVVPPLKAPGFAPVGLNPTQAVPDQATNTTEVEDLENMPTPPVPPFILGQNQPNPDADIAQPMSPDVSVSVVDVSPNGTSVETKAINPQTTLPPLCELDMLDVEPSLSQLSESLIDLEVLWLERQPLPPLPPPLYFSIRYGPVIRKLVDDNRQQSEIIPGRETILRTSQETREMPFLPDPTRSINITGLQHGSLLKIQICALFDPKSEPLIQWDTVLSHRIDLAALEPFLEMQNVAPPVAMSPLDILPDGAAAAIDMSPVPAVMVPLSPSMESSSDRVVDVPMVIAVNVEPNTPSAATCWLTILAGVLLTILTAALVFVCLLRLCSSRRLTKRIHVVEEKPTVFVNMPSPPPPTVHEVVKVPLP